MATTTVTTLNWNDPAFWSGQSVSNGDTLDLSALGAGYTLDFDSFGDTLTLSDGATSFTVNGAGTPGGDANLGSGQVFQFDQIFFPDGASSADTGGDSDTVQGGDGDDSIHAGGGSDTIDGGEGGDTLDGGDGDDSLVGGTGDDRDIFMLSDGNDTIVGAPGSSGSRDDIIDYTNASSGISVSWSTQYDGSVSMGAYTTTFTGVRIFQAGDVSSTTGGTDDVFDASLADGAISVLDYLGGADTVTGSAFGDALTFYGHQASSTDGLSLDAGAGDDYIEVSGGTVTMSGGDGDDYILYHTADADDTAVIDAGAGNDSIYGDTSAMTIRTGAGDDEVIASTKDDTFIIEDGFGNDTLRGWEGDETSGDVIDLSGLTGSVTVTYTGVEAGTITDGTDTITFSEIERLILSDQADTLDGSLDSAGLNVDAGDGNDALEGGTGDDRLDGGIGADTLLDGAGNDTVLGGAGEDSIYVDAGNDSVFGGVGDDYFYIRDNAGANSIDGGDDYDILKVNGSGSNVTFDTGTTGTFTMSANATGTFDNIESFIGTNGNDTLDANLATQNVVSNLGSGDDVLVGGAGDDTLHGSAGNDSLDGGVGDNQLFGGAGEDTLVVGSGYNWLRAGNDADLFEVNDGFGTGWMNGEEGGDDRDTVDLSQLSTAVTVTYGNNDVEGGTITDGANTINFRGIETVILTEQGDLVDATVSRSAGGDGPGVTVDGGGGNDTLLGGLGQEFFEGGDGDDVIEGDRGDDSLLGGAGNDTILGGSTGLTFTWDGNDTIDGGAGDDSIFSRNEADTVYGGTGNDTIDAGSGDDYVEGGAGNDLVDGGDDDDTLIGGTGDDTLAGQDGDDLFVYSLGDGADTITDFNTGNTGALNDGDTTNNDFIDLSAFYTNVFELRADFDDDGALNQSNDGVDGADFGDNTRFGAGDSLTFTGATTASFTTDNTGVICFAAETRIQTPRGQVRICDLKVGDLVDTLDNGPQPVRWLGRRDVDRAELLANPRLLPIRIKPGVLGNEHALVVSRQHGLLLGRRGTVLVRASKLLKNIEGVHVARHRTAVTYLHLMFDRHQIVLANGVPAESFYPGRTAISMLDHTARQSFESHFGSTADVHANPDAVVDMFGPTARPFETSFRRARLTC